MIRFGVFLGFVSLLVGTALADDPGQTGYCSGKPCVTTFHNGNTRTGVNPHETTLSPSNLPTASTPITGFDGMIYGQPLYVSGVPVIIGACTTTRNMVYVATENNSVYAIDADNYAICASQTLNKSGESAIPVTALPPPQGQTVPCNNLTGSSTYGTVGVTSTGAIDPGSYNGSPTNVWFVASAHQSGSNYISRLNAVDITSLTIIDQLDLNTPISQAMPQGYPMFYTLNEDQRAALLLDKGATAANIYVAFGSFCDGSTSAGGYFGLVAEFDYSYASKKFATTAETFYPAGTTSGNQSGAGVWMSGGGPAADATGNVYFATGNGPFTATGAPQNFGESIVKLGGSSGATALEDYYTPNVWSALNSGSGGSKVVCSPGCLFQAPGLASTDWDLDSGGVVILTPSSSTAAGELIAGGKEGVFYVIYYCSSSTQCPPSTGGWNAWMGGLDGGGYGTNFGSQFSLIGCTTSGTGSIAQCFQGIVVDPSKTADQGLRSTPAFWAPTGATSYLYALGVSTINSGGLLSAFSFSSGQFNTTPATGTAPGGGYFKVPGAGPVVTWNGSSATSALVWVLDTSAWKSSTSNQAVLTAYAAVPSGSTLQQKWTSPTSSGPGAVKFMAPTIANGKIYVAGQNLAPGCTGGSCGGMLVIYH